MPALTENSASVSLPRIRKLTRPIVAYVCPVCLPGFPCLPSGQPGPHQERRHLLAALRMWVGHDPEILARPGFGGTFGEDGVGVKKRSACGSDMDCPLCC